MKSKAGMDAGERLGSKTMVRVLKVVVVLGVIAVLGVVAYHRSLTTRQPMHPFLAEVERLDRDVEQLLADLCARIELLDAVTVKLANAMTDLDSRCSEIQVEIDAARTALDEQSEWLDQYKALAEKGQGAILPGGEYISADVVQRQYRYEFTKLERMRTRLDVLAEHLGDTDRFRQSTKRRYETAKTTLARMRQSAEQLRAERDRLALCRQSYSDQSETRLLLSKDVVGLQLEVEGIQDYLDEYFPESYSSSFAPEPEFSISLD